MTLVLNGKGPCFGGLTFKNRGQIGALGLLWDHPFSRKKINSRCQAILMVLAADGDKVGEELWMSEMGGELVSLGFFKHQNWVV